MAIFDEDTDLDIEFTQFAIPDGQIQAHVPETVTGITKMGKLTTDSIILSFNENGGDSHPDHIATHAIAKTLASRHGIPMLEFGLPGDPSSTTSLSGVDVDVAPKFVAHHVSQFGVAGENLHHPHRSLLNYNSINLRRF